MFTLVHNLNLYLLKNITGIFSGVLCAEKDVTYIILFTYMRSGSTLTGEFLRNDPNIFYVFEPLKQLE